ncbi:hypothetical protein CH263_06475 [Rhodococcus sp. 06-1059B-a]|nr:hypothetical protein CH263_06475 [Rhodococcus sp. 06-1059B-a]
MKSNPVMRWVVDSRNKIVKESDLDTESLLLITLIPDYDAEALTIADEQMTWANIGNLDPLVIAKNPVQAPVNLTVEEVFNRLDDIELPLMIKQAATVLLERKWVEKGVPQYEILTLLAYAYGWLNSLISRCHELMGMRLARVSVGFIDGEDTSAGAESANESATIASVEPIDELPAAGRLPCMISTLPYRSTRFRLIDRSEVTEFKNWDVDYSPRMARAIAESGMYGVPPEFPATLAGDLQTADQLGELVRFYASLGELILQSGQSHGWFSYYFRRGENLGARVHASVDKQGKHAVASAIARTALELQADAVAMISETWTSPMTHTPDGAYVPPSLHPQRTEALSIDAVAASGARAGGLLRFETLGGEPPRRRVTVGEFSPQEGSSRILLATLAAWGMREERLAGAAFWRAQNANKGHPFI